MRTIKLRRSVCSTQIFSGAANGPDVVVVTCSPSFGRCGPVCWTLDGRDSVRLSFFSLLHSCTVDCGGRELDAAAAAAGRSGSWTGVRAVTGPPRLILRELCVLYGGGGGGARARCR